MQKRLWQRTLNVFRSSFIVFKKHDPLTMAAATAFFTSFAIPPILIILIQFFGPVSNRQTISQQLFDHLTIMLGRDSMIQMRRTLNGFEHLAGNGFIAVAGFIFMIFVATTLFNVVSGLFNQLWDIGRKNTGNVWLFFRTRLKFFAVIIATGLMFFAHLGIERLQSIIFHAVTNSNSFYTILTYPLSAIIIIGWFTLLYRYLGNAHPHWKAAIAGGVFTGIWYGIGRLILSHVLTATNIRTVFGHAGSLVQVLLFVFYISFIVYFGWVLVKMHSIEYNLPIVLDEGAYELPPVDQPRLRDSSAV